MLDYTLHATADGVEGGLVASRRMKGKSGAAGCRGDPGESLVYRRMMNVAWMAHPGCRCGVDGGIGS